MYFIIIAIVVVVVVLYRRLMRCDIKSEPLFLKNRDYDRSDGFTGYAKAWYIMMSSGELKTNEVKAISMCEQEFVVFRGPSGKVHALNAYCCHLGANIGIGGKVTQKEGKECISCPFHGWVFDGSNGKCVQIPNIESNDIPTKARIATWPVMEQDHMIYLWYDSEGGEPTYIMENFSKSCGFDMKSPLISEDFVFYNNFKLLAENGFDLEHFPFVHAKMAWGLVTMRLHAEPIEDEPNGPKSHIRRISHTVIVSLYGVGDVAKVSLELGFSSPVLPELKFIITTPFMNMTGLCLTRILPLSPMKTQYTFYLFPKASVFSWLADRILMKRLSILLYQDVPIWSNRKSPRHECLIKHDKHIVEYRHWAKHFGTTGDKDAMNTN